MSKVETHSMHSNNQTHNHTEDDLKKSAGEILNGVKRTVEVQVVNPNSFNFQDQTILGMTTIHINYRNFLQFSIMLAEENTKIFH